MNSVSPAVKGLDEEEVRDNLVVLARQDQDPETEFPDIAEDTGQDEIYSRVVDDAFDLVILDNFSVLAQVNDENDAAAMAPVLAFLMRLKQANKATILVHHSGKGGNDYRGSSKLATTFGKAIMHYEGTDIGSSRQPIYDAARYLLANGLALPSDRITTYQDGRPCMLSIVGRAAKLTVQENDNGGLTLCAYRPFKKEAVVQRDNVAAECLAAE
jgi:hypothetical protein